MDQLEALIAAMQEQTRAINNLAASNMALVEQMAKSEDEPEPDQEFSFPQPMSRKR